VPPSNLYGVANAPIVAALNGQGSIVCPPGVSTIVLGVGPVIAPSQGYFYPATWWFLDFTFGAALPSQILFAFRIGSGSNLDAVQLDLSSMVAGQTFQTTICMFGPPSSTPWGGVGSIINYTITPTGQAVTANPTSGRAWFTLFRAPDQ